MNTLEFSSGALLTATLIWLVGPIIWILLARLRLQAPLTIAIIGAATFLLAWLGSVGTSTVLTVAGVAPSSLIWAVAVSCSAGVCEETSRYLVFRTAYMRRHPGWGTGVMHTLGHSGIESAIECLTTLAALALVIWAAGLIPADQLESLRQTTGTDLLFTAGLRVGMGPILHGLFATFAYAAVTRGRPALLGLAIAGHAGHDIIAHRISSLGETAVYVWLGASIVAYAALILWLRARWFTEDSAPA